MNDRFVVMGTNLLLNLDEIRIIEIDYHVVPGVGTKQWRIEVHFKGVEAPHYFEYTTAQDRDDTYNDIQKHLIRS